jgi:hypothetical protein
VIRYKALDSNKIRENEATNLFIISHLHFCDVGRGTSGKDAQPSTTRDLPKTGPAGESAPREGILRNKATKCLFFNKTFSQMLCKTEERRVSEGAACTLVT